MDYIQDLNRTAYCEGSTLPPLWAGYWQVVPVFSFYVLWDVMGAYVRRVKDIPKH